MNVSLQDSSYAIKLDSAWDRGPAIIRSFNLTQDILVIPGSIFIKGCRASWETIQDYILKNIAAYEGKRKQDKSHEENPQPPKPPVDYLERISYKLDDIENRLSEQSDRLDSFEELLKTVEQFLAVVPLVRSARREVTEPSIVDVPPLTPYETVTHWKNATGVFACTGTAYAGHVTTSAYESKDPRKVTCKYCRKNMDAVVHYQSAIEATPCDKAGYEKAPWKTIDFSQVTCSKCILWGNSPASGEYK
jgi:hypothetical protein